MITKNSWISTLVFLLALGLVVAPLACTAEEGAGGGTATAAPSGDTPSGETGDDEASGEETSDGDEASPAGDSGGGSGDDAALASIRSFIDEQDIDKSAANWKTRLPKPAVATFNADSSYFWNLATSEGDIKIRLMTDVAPMHCTSTIYLSEVGFYDDVTFHRIIPNFMAQGGDPLGNGRGGPGYKYGGEFDSTVRHDRPGLLSMANAGPNTDGSQFFLTFVPTPHLNDKHTIFGEVVSGMDTVKKLEQVGVKNPGRNGMLAASARPVIKKATITVE